MTKKKAKKPNEVVVATANAAPHFDDMSSSGIDSSSHRQNRNYSRKILLARVLWGVLQCFFRWSPRHLYGWRNFLLRAMGAKIGQSVRIYPSAEVFYPWNLEIGDNVTVGWKVQLYSLGKITLGDNVMVSQGAHLCSGTHDYRKAHFPLITMPIRVGEGTWVCADAFIGPGVVVGPASVVGARAVLMKTVSEKSLVAGNPATVVKKLK